MSRLFSRRSERPNDARGGLPVNQPDPALIARLRSMAKLGTTINELVGEVRRHLGTEDGLALVVDRYFCAAFRLPLGEVRPIEGSECLGRSVYSCDEIDRLMLPRIEAARPLWDDESADPR